MLKNSCSILILNLSFIIFLNIFIWIIHPRMSEEALRNPFVIFCNKCNKILSDSFTLLDYKNNSLIHTFSTVKEEEKVEEGQNSFINCLVQNIVCPCGNKVGFYVKSASGEYNGYSETYAFLKDKINSYGLGSSVNREKTLVELSEDVEKLKNVVSKIYKKIF